MPSRQLILASNRLPVSIKTDDEGSTLVPSSGGLASALRQIHEASQGHWVGWLGDTAKLPQDKVAWLQGRARAQRLKPVSLSASEVSLYYDGYSNAVLWPLFHYLLDKVRLDASQEWRAYVHVNERFAEAIASEISSQDMVWIHDYQLILVPAEVRKRVAAARIGFFLHIPWPSPDVFRILPSRVQLLKGLLGADLLGFQTENDRQNFLLSAAQVLDVDLGGETLSWEEREVRTGVYPIGVDVPSMSRDSAEIRAAAAQIRAKTQGKCIALGVDRLDYTKGLPRRLVAIDHLLRREPALRERLHYVQLAVPSREKVEAYAELRRTVNELVTRINSHHGSPTDSPVQLLYRNIPMDQLIALYRCADVMLVTPLRDGMNLVAKEYVTARISNDGCLVLSEFAGAAAELATAIRVNPYDIGALADAIRRAMFMPLDEQRLRMVELRRIVERQPVQKWADDFVRDLDAAKPSLPAPPSSGSNIDAALRSLAEARHRTLLFDYDGTLVPIAELPNLAAPDAALLALLRELQELPDTTVHVITGRSRESIEAWLGSLPIWLHVEHGLRSRQADGTWMTSLSGRLPEIDSVAQIMEKHVARARGAFMEQKEASLAFHYRRVSPHVAQETLASLRVELTRMLPPTLQLLEGHKVLEVRLAGVSKRNAVLLALANAPDDSLALAAGDDRTDEDMFAALPNHGLSIRIGKGGSLAKLHVDSPQSLRQLLARLAQMTRQHAIE